MTIDTLTYKAPHLEIADQSDSDDDGIEKECQEPNGKITDPYAPELIRIRPVNIVVDQLISRIEYDEIDLAPEFQRQSGIWTRTNKSRLIESLLLRIPIPVFYVAANENEAWSVVDGVQRMSTINDYVRGNFKLTGIQYLSQLEDYYHSDLPRAMQRRISETQLVVNVIEPGTPEDVKIDVFRRINTLGSPLTSQEIRHALHPDPARSMLKDLADSPEFLKATHSSINPIRMRDREFVLRFLAFHIHDPANYAAKSLDGFLGQTMVEINHMNDHRRRFLADDFSRAMRAASRIFGVYAFRKRYKHADRKRPVNTALFETWAVHLARCSPDQITELTGRKREVVSRSIKLIKNDAEFEDAVSTSTASPRRVRKRFAAVGTLVKEFV